MKLHPIQKEFVDGRGYSREDWDAVDSPEMSDEQLANLRPFKDVFPDIHALIECEAAKERQVKRVSVSLDADIIDRFKATGKGWQERVNEALRKASPV